MQCKDCVWYEDVSDADVKGVCFYDRPILLNQAGEDHKGKSSWFLRLRVWPDDRCHDWEAKSEQVLP